LLREHRLPWLPRARWSRAVGGPQRGLMLRVAVARHSLNFVFQI
jgi:hypothetical protein